MPHVPPLPVTPSGSPEPVAADADYDALTDALMQTRRGRWFLAEHARRCREADQADLRAILTRIEQALAEPREPSGLAAIQEQLGALPRIEQALADHRDPPAMAELRESLTALPRIEQALAEPRESAGMTQLHERVSAFAQTLDDVRAEVAAQRPAKPDEAERARAREEEMLRLLHEQRERLDALADIWARVQEPAVAPQTTAESQEAATAIAETAASFFIGGQETPPPVERQPGPAGETAGDDAPATAEEHGDPAEAAIDPASMPPDAQTSTADLLNQTAIFGHAEPRAEARARTEETEPASPPAERPFAPLTEAAPEASADPIVQIFVDAEPAAVGNEAGRSAPAHPSDASPLPKRTKLPAWLVGDDGSDGQTSGYTALDAERGDDDAVADQAGVQPPFDAVIDEDEALFEADMKLTAPADAATVTASSDRDPHQEAAAEDELFMQPSAEPWIEPQPASAPHPETGPDGPRSASDEDSSAAAEPARAEMPGLAELTLDLLHKALFSNASQASQPAAAGALDRALGGSFAKAVAESDLRAAVAALHQALGHGPDQELESEVVSEVVILDDLPVHPPSPASSRTPEPAASTRESPRKAAAPSDPLATLHTLSEEERIALFS